MLKWLKKTNVKVSNFDVKSSGSMGLQQLNPEFSAATAARVDAVNYVLHTTH
jgi:uncharacterized protein (UPF0303 family)